MAFASVGLMAQDVVVEPSNWWVGMKEPRVQLLMHAENLADYTPQLSATGVSITSVEKTDNKNYLFVNIDIDANATAQTVNITLKADGKSDITVPYELKARKENSAQRKGFSSEDAVYLLMPDRFAKGAKADKSDDSKKMLEQTDRKAPYGRHGGDIQGVIDHLDYIQKLGMTTLWMTPVLENNMPESSYHGYAITNYYRIDPRFGTLDDFCRLSDELHNRGMKHIMDMVFNHCGTNHWWMQKDAEGKRDLPCADWINVWNDSTGAETFVRSNYRLSIVFDPHASQADKDITMKGWFDTSMADMNLSNPLVKNYFIQNSIWWIETADLDGIRQDTYPYSDPDAMREWCERVLEEYPNFNIVGETWISDPGKVSIWQRRKEGTPGFNSGLPTIMDFPLQDAICAAFNEDEGWSNGANRFYDLFGADFLYSDPMNLLIFGENHDVGRLYTYLNTDTAALRMATALLATARGIPQLYYGTEILFEGKGHEGHANIRADFPGGFKGDKTNYFKKLPKGRQKMYDFTAALFNFRKTSKALQHGTMTHYMPEGNVYIYFRTDAESNEKVAVFLNLSKEKREVNLSHFAELEGTMQGTDVVTGESVNEKGTMTLLPRTPLVVNLK